MSTYRFGTEGQCNNDTATCFNCRSKIGQDNGIRFEYGRLGKTGTPWCTGCFDEMARAGEVSTSGKTTYIKVDDGKDDGNQSAQSSGGEKRYADQSAPRNAFNAQEELKNLKRYMRDEILKRLEELERRMAIHDRAPSNPVSGGSNLQTSNAVAGNPTPANLFAPNAGIEGPI